MVRLKLQRDVAVRYLRRFVAIGIVVLSVTSPMQTSAFIDPGRSDTNCETDSCILVTGQPIFGDPFAGGEPGGGVGGGSGEPGAGGGEPVEVAANRFNAGCQREDMVRNAVVAAAQAGTPTETTVPSNFAQLLQAASSLLEDLYTGEFSLSGGTQDPKYQDPSWHKYKVIVQGKHYTSTENAAAGLGEPFLIEVHYWWNDQSHQVEQAKFKNTKEQGCVGQITSVG